MTLSFSATWPRKPKWIQSNQNMHHPHWLFTKAHWRFVEVTFTISLNLQMPKMPMESYGTESSSVLPLKRNEAWLVNWDTSCAYKAPLKNRKGNVFRFSKPKRSLWRSLFGIHFDLPHSNCIGKLDLHVTYTWRNIDVYCFLPQSVETFCLSISESKKNLSENLVESWLCSVRKAWFYHKWCSQHRTSLLRPCFSSWSFTIAAFNVFLSKKWNCKRLGVKINLSSCFYLAHVWCDSLNT